MCSVDFQVAEVTANAITTNLTIHCDRGMLRYDVHASSTIDPNSHTASSSSLGSKDSTQVTVSGLLADTSYNLVLQLVDPQCFNSTAATLLNVTTDAATVGE